MVSQDLFANLIWMVCIISTRTKGQDVFQLTTYVPDNGRPLDTRIILRVSSPSVFTEAHCIHFLITFLVSRAYQKYLHKELKLLRSSQSPPINATDKV